MKLAHLFSGHATYDLTECKVHRRDDGAIVAFFPKKWEVRVPKQTINVVAGSMAATQYAVTEWDEIVLVPAPVKS